MNYLQQLKKIVPPPRKPVEAGTPKTWEKVETRFGTHLPGDYKAFIDLYGSGNFNNTLLIYNPHSNTEYLNLSQVLETHHQSNLKTGAILGSPWSVVKPFEFYPAPDGLLPWGSTNDLCKGFFWQVTGPPQTWPTVFYDLANGEYEVWKLNLTEFLVKLFQRKIKTVLLPEQFFPLDMPVSFHQVIQSVNFNGIRP